MNSLIAHTRTHGLFSTYAPRITLQQGQLAHALGQPTRALECYRVAEWLAGGGGAGEKDEWVRVAARAGQVWVRLGLMRRGKTPLGMNETANANPEAAVEELRELGAAVARECEGMGGNLMAIGEVIRACLVKEYLGAKYVLLRLVFGISGVLTLGGRNHLRRALDLATTAQDNHLRGLVLALVASHYLHTAREHAETMLDTCEQLAAGLGAAPEKGKKGDGVGNARLRLWVGERFLGGFISVYF
jgi:hypothetical protein